MLRCLILVATLLLTQSCSPLKSSPQEEKHQMELTVHEIQTNLDDLRHDFSCYKTDLDILNDKIKHHESTLSQIKQKHVQREQIKIEELTKRIAFLEAKLKTYEKEVSHHHTDLTKSLTHLDEVTQALTQYKARIIELEKEIVKQNNRFQEVANLKNTLEQVANSLENPPFKNLENYRVKAGDSLDKIARKYGSNVIELKKINQLQNDLIVIGQEIKVPIR